MTKDKRAELCQGFHPKIRIKGEAFKIRCFSFYVSKARGEIPCLAEEWKVQKLNP